MREVRRTRIYKGDHCGGFARFDSARVGRGVAGGGGGRLRTDCWRSSRTRGSPQLWALSWTWHRFRAEQYLRRKPFLRRRALYVACCTALEPTLSRTTSHGYNTYVCIHNNTLHGVSNTCGLYRVSPLWYTTASESWYTNTLCPARIRDVEQVKRWAYNGSGLNGSNYICGWVLGGWRWWFLLSDDVRERPYTHTHTHTHTEKEGEREWVVRIREREWTRERVRGRIEEDARRGDVRYMRDV